MKATRGARRALRYLLLTLGVYGALGACSSDEGSSATCDQVTYEACDGARPGVRLGDPENGYGRCELAPLLLAAAPAGCGDDDDGAAGPCAPYVTPARLPGCESFSYAVAGGTGGPSDFRLF